MVFWKKSNKSKSAMFEEEKVELLVKVLVLGASSAGITAFVQKSISSEWVLGSPSGGAGLFESDALVLENELIQAKFYLWDCAKLEAYASLYASDATDSLVITVVDAGDSDSVQEAIKALQTYQSNLQKGVVVTWLLVFSKVSSYYDRRNGEDEFWYRSLHAQISRETGIRFLKTVFYTDAERSLGFSDVWAFIMKRLTNAYHRQCEDAVRIYDAFSDDIATSSTDLAGPSR